MSDVTKYDRFLHDGGPAALVIREHVMPVEGTHGVLSHHAAANGHMIGLFLDVRIVVEDAENRNVIVRVAKGGGSPA